jgi:hypothetical protein
VTSFSDDVARNFSRSDMPDHAARYASENEVTTFQAARPRLM